MNVHRENQWQLQLMQQRANVDNLSDQVDDLRRQLHEAIEQRDLARRVAVALEQEPHVCAVCSSVLVAVPVLGEAL